MVQKAFMCYNGFSGIAFERRFFEPRFFYITKERGQFVIENDVEVLS